MIREVKNYQLTYNPDKNMVTVYLRIEDVDFESGARIFDMPPNEAAFVADMLRYEKPLYWNDEKKELTTVTEPTGEEES